MVLVVRGAVLLHVVLTVKPVARQQYVLLSVIHVTLIVTTIVMKLLVLIYVIRFVLVGQRIRQLSHVLLLVRPPVNWIVVLAVI